MYTIKGYTCDFRDFEEVVDSFVEAIRKCKQYEGELCNVILYSGSRYIKTY